MRFLADMGVDIRIVQWLTQNGHDAKHTFPSAELRILSIQANSVSLFSPALRKGEIGSCDEAFLIFYCWNIPALRCLSLDKHQNLGTNKFI